MPDLSGPGDGTRSDSPHRPLMAGLDGSEDGGRPEAAPHRVGWQFILLYVLAQMGTSLVFLAPLLVTLALKIGRGWPAYVAPAFAGI